MLEVKFQEDMSQVSDPVKTYVGDPDKWPVGVYRNPLGSICVKCSSSACAFLFHPSGQGANLEHARTVYTRISDDPRIASITFAGSMNYPDGKPEGGNAS
jgi:hypothetical protein